MNPRRIKEKLETGFFAVFIFFFVATPFVFVDYFILTTVFYYIDDDYRVAAEKERSACPIFSAEGAHWPIPFLVAAGRPKTRAHEDAKKYKMKAFGTAVLAHPICVVLSSLFSITLGVITVRWLNKLEKESIKRAIELKKSGRGDWPGRGFTDF